MSRPVLLALLLAAGACNGDAPSDAPVDTDVDDTAAIETGLYAETDTDAIWPDTGLDTDTDAHTDTLDTDAGCAPGWVKDCNDECYAARSIGDGFCDDGPAPKAHFDCAQHRFDGGDCVVDTDLDTGVCGPGDVQDCNLQCFPAFLVGNGTCQDGTGPGGVDFACERLDWDGGDCAPDTDVDTDVIDTDAADTDAIPLPCSRRDYVRDCNGRCYYEGWLGDGACDDGTVQPWGRPDFQCALHEFDRGDCPVP